MSKMALPRCILLTYFKIQVVCVLSKFKTFEMICSLWQGFLIYQEIKSFVNFILVN